MDRTGRCIGSTALGVCLFLALGCRPAQGEYSSAVSAAEETASAEFRRIMAAEETTAHACRTVIPGSTATFVVFNDIERSGGVTCFDGTRRIRFAPAEDASCDSVTGASLRTMAAAEAEFYRCSAAYRPSAHGNVRSVVYQLPADASDEARDHFGTLGIDLAALIVYDALPVTHLGVVRGLICMEAPAPREVVDRVLRADIFDPAEVEWSIHSEPCRVVGARISGSHWPEVSGG